MAAATTINPNDHLPIQSEFYSSSNFGLDSIYHQLPSSNLPPFPPLPLPPTSSAQTHSLLAGSFGAVSSGSDNEFSTGTPTSPDSSPHSPMTPQLPPLPYGQTGAAKTPTILPPLVGSYPAGALAQVPGENPTRKRKNAGPSRRGRRTSARGGGGRKGGGKGSKASKQQAATPASPTALSPPQTPATPQGEVDELGETGLAAVAIPSGQYRELIQDAVLKKKRLQRKAELARLSRKKKQTRLAELERQVAALKEENRRLQVERTHLQSTAFKDVPVPTPAPAPIIPQAPEDKDNSKVLEGAVAKLMDLCSANNPALSGAAGGQEGESKMSELVGNVAQALKKQSSSVDAAMKVLEQALVPCTAMQFLEWSLVQKDKFYESDGLFMSLFRDEMGGSEDQVKKLMTLRAQLYQHSLKIKDQQLLDAFRSFQNSFNSRGRIQQPDAFDQLRTIFTPKQLALFFKWVNQYGAVLLKVPM